MHDANPLIAILRGVQPFETAAHVEALIEEGFRYLEIPLNSPGWQQSIAGVGAKFGRQACIGAGTVLKVEQVTWLADAGARLIVTPNTDPRVIALARERGMLVCAGCATATEAFTALEAGAQWLKIFPSSAFGPAYISALKAVLPPETPMLAVGGITPDNLPLYLDAGCQGAGLGSDLYRAGQDVKVTRQQGRRFMDALRRYHR
ncbi:2-dehydro-3-deoxy-6-phosphogalactonate aldolase [Cedecea neteri]|uniref:2-dehydro-3-deoxy-6-phosphogalactonate aldolase n=1 Tax=Cedecea neteri TaxID=158822 RepID=UPI002AA7882E|nr:2-dehydro-3-deoxy-6-phosphogalactonate aldolase [Cedecea neteri]WPU22739.1 2-dehydro-3-deoxy-6-phosphogalactonate aldolase [Cedecea neteri]